MSNAVWYFTTEGEKIVLQARFEQGGSGPGNQSRRNVAFTIIEIVAFLSGGRETH